MVHYKGIGGFFVDSWICNYNIVFDEISSYNTVLRGSNLIISFFWILLNHIIDLSNVRVGGYTIKWNSKEHVIMLHEGFKIHKI